MERKSKFQWVVSELKRQFPEWKGFIDQFTDKVKPVWVGNQSRFQTHFIHVFGFGFKKDWDRIFTTFLTLSNWVDTSSLFTIRKESIANDWDLFVKESMENRIPKFLYVEDGFKLLDSNTIKYELKFSNYNLTTDDQRVLGARNWYTKKRDLKVFDGTTTKIIPSLGTLVFSWFELGETLQDKISTIRHYDSRYNTERYSIDPYSLGDYAIAKMNFVDFNEAGLIKFMEDKNSSWDIFKAIGESQIAINYFLKSNEIECIYPNMDMFWFFMRKIDKVPDNLDEFTSQLTNEVLSRCGFLIEVMKFISVSGTINVYDFHKSQDLNYERCEIFFRSNPGEPYPLLLIEFRATSLEELFVKNDKLD